MDSLDKVRVGEISEEVIKVLKEKFPQYGISIKGGSYGDAYINLGLLISLPDEKGVLETLEEKDFKKYAVLVGLSPEDLHKKFILKGGEEYIVSGFLRGRDVNPILGVRIKDKKQFVFKAETVKKYLVKES